MLQKPGSVAVDNDMASRITIEDIYERALDLVEVLREYEADDAADSIESHTKAFSSHIDVRRSVAAIQQILEVWRHDPDQLPDSGWNPKDPKPAPVSRAEPPSPQEPA